MLHARLNPLLLAPLLATASPALAQDVQRTEYGWWSLVLLAVALTLVVWFVSMRRRSPPPPPPPQR